MVTRYAVAAAFCLRLFPGLAHLVEESQQLRREHLALERDRELLMLRAEAALHEQGWLEELAVPIQVEVPAGAEVSSHAGTLTFSPGTTSKMLVL